MSRRWRGVAVGVVVGLAAGVAVSARAAGSDEGPPVSDYEIVRMTFAAEGKVVEEGVARCSTGKLVMGGGARILHPDGAGYVIEASDPTGPNGWEAMFRRPDPEERRSVLPPGNPPEPEPEPATEFEVSAVCAAVR